MDMFYNNPIRTLLVLVCFLASCFEMSAQCAKYTFQVTRARYNGPCTDINGSDSNPDMGLYIGTNSSGPAGSKFSSTDNSGSVVVANPADLNNPVNYFGNIYQGVLNGSASVFVNGTPSNASALTFTGAPTSIGTAGAVMSTLTSGGTIFVGTFEDNSGVGSHVPDGLYQTSADQAWAFSPVALPTGTTAVTRTIVNGCFTIDLLITPTNPASIVLPPTVRVCAGGSLLSSGLDAAALAALYTSEATIDAAGYTTLQLLGPSVPGANSNILSSINNTLAVTDIRDLLGTFAVATPPGTYTYTVRASGGSFPGSSVNCITSYPFTVQVIGGPRVVSQQILAPCNADGTVTNVTYQIAVPAGSTAPTATGGTVSAANPPVFTAGPGGVPGANPATPTSSTATEDFYTFTGTITNSGDGFQIGGQCGNTTVRFVRDLSGPLTCGSLVNMSLGSGQNPWGATNPDGSALTLSTCQAILTPDLLVRGGYLVIVGAPAGILAPPVTSAGLNNYTITLFDPFGNMVANGARIGNENYPIITGPGTYKYEITSVCGDKCWGEIKAEDKSAPVCSNPVNPGAINCSVPVTVLEPLASPSATVGATGTTGPAVYFLNPTPSTAVYVTAAGVSRTKFTGAQNQGEFTFSPALPAIDVQAVGIAGGTTKLVQFRDGCGITRIGYTDNIEETCDANGTVRTVRRSWYAVDVNGNKQVSLCTNVFTFVKPVTTNESFIAIPGEVRPIGYVGGTGPMSYEATYTTLVVPGGAAFAANAASFTAPNYNMLMCDDNATVRNTPAAITALNGDGNIINNATTGVPRVWNAATGRWIDIAPSSAAACMITSSFTDEFIADACSVGVGANSIGKIVRKWTVVDMCTKVTKTGTQIITVMARRPQVTPTDEDKNCAGVQRLLSVDPGQCTSSGTILNHTTPAQRCGVAVTDAFITITAMTSNWSCADGYTLKNGLAFPIQLRGLDAKVPDLPAGEYNVTYNVVNQCGVRSDMDETTTALNDYTFQLRITDNEAPTAIAVDQLTVSLSNATNGSTRIYATAVDKGSRDNCGLGLIQRGNTTVNDIQVALVPASGKTDDIAASAWADFVTVSCDNPTRMVALRVRDCARGRDAACNVVALNNTNIVMVPFTIQDKSPAACFAPGAMTMDCSVWANDIKPVVGTGSVTVTGDNNPQAIEVFRRIFGSANNIYSCGGAISESSVVNVDACGVGTITRTFTARKTGLNGETSTSTCSQVVTFTSNKPQGFVVNFPKNYTSAVCSLDPTVAGRPAIDSVGACENVQVSYTDEVFVSKDLNVLNPGSVKTCKKIIRTWKVINMCIYNPTLQNYLPEGDADCVYDDASVNAAGVMRRFDGVYGLNATDWDGVYVSHGVFAPGGAYAGDFASTFGGAVNMRRTRPGVNSFAVNNGNANPLLATNAINFNNFWDPTCYGSNGPIAGVAPWSLWANRARIKWMSRTAAGQLRARDRAGDGVIRYVQVINIEDNTAPVFTTTCPKPESNTPVAAKTITDCTGTIELTNNAGDNCPGDVNMTLTVVSPDRDFRAADGSSVASTFVGGGKAPYTGTLTVPLNKVLTAIWTATDECGNISTCSYKINVPDTKAPIVVCRDLSTELMALGTNSMLDLTADKFVLMATDNCTDMATMMASASFDAAGTQKTRRFTCADIRASGVVDVQIYVRDAAGNTNFCRTNAFFRPEDRTACGFNGSTASVAGLIQNETSEGVEKVTVKMNADAGVTAIETGTDGKFNYNLPLNKDYSVNPAKTTGLLNGVSTYDLVLIQKHILDVEKLNSSYKVVAADVNKDGKVTTLDIVELRKAILRISSTFPNGNNSWRFVSKNYAFSSTEGAAGETFPETYNINNLKAQQKADFVGVKVGDVNESAAPNSLIGAEERGARKAFVMTAEDRIVKTGEEVTMNVVADAANVAGFQYTMNFDKNALEFAGVKAGAINVTDANVAVVEGALTTSWNGEATNGNLFTVVFRAKADGRLSELVNVNSRYTEAEAYTKQAETMNVELRFNGTAANGFALFQNQPNPFTKETIIGFNLPSAQAATLKVYDVTGKAVKVVNADYAKGYNEVKIADLKATGVLYYTLETQGFTATKKMVIVE